MHSRGSRDEVARRDAPRFPPRAWVPPEVRRDPWIRHHHERPGLDRVGVAAREPLHVFRSENPGGAGRAPSIVIHSSSAPRFPKPEPIGVAGRAPSRRCGTSLHGGGAFAHYRGARAIESKRIGGTRGSWRSFCGRECSSRSIGRARTRSRCETCGAVVRMRNRTWYVPGWASSCYREAWCSGTDTLDLRVIAGGWGSSSSSTMPIGPSSKTTCGRAGRGSADKPRPAGLKRSAHACAPEASGCAASNPRISE